MRRIALALAAAGVIAAGVAAGPAQAHERWVGYDRWQTQEWREHAWREHEWREHLDRHRDLLPALIFGMLHHR